MLENVSITQSISSHNANLALCDVIVAWVCYNNIETLLNAGAIFTHMQTVYTMYQAFLYLDVGGLGTRLAYNHDSNAEFEFTCLPLPGGDNVPSLALPYIRNLANVN